MQLLSAHCVLLGIFNKAVHCVMCCVPSGSRRGHGEQRGGAPSPHVPKGAPVFPRVPGLLLCTVSSLNHALQREKRTALPQETLALAGSAGMQQEEAWSPAQ